MATDTLPRRRMNATGIPLPGLAIRPSATTRRDLFGAAGFTALAGIAAASFAMPETPKSDDHAETPDAALIAACERFIAIERQRSASYDEPERASDHPETRRREAIRDALDDEQGALVARMRTMRATTPAGFQAQARTIRAYMSDVEQRGDDDGYLDDQLVWLLLRDLTAGDAA